MSFKISVFLSAFLLFIIQPLITKKLLPWFGGSANVWLCNILFFQAILLLGYLYSFFLTKIKPLTAQVKIHFALLALSLVFLPIMPKETFASLQIWPPLVILLVLISSIGLPCILISASSPLFQFWHNHCYQTPFPYRYYALSNFGSLLGLLAFPFLLEPYLGLKTQLILWSCLYGLFCLSSLSCFRLVAHGPLPSLEAEVKPAALPWQNIVSWFILGFFSNALLLSVTQVMMQSVVSFPLLWIIPLALYLITFIITFYSKKAYVRPVWVVLFTLSFAIILYVPTQHQFLLSCQILLYGLLLFSGCMICHGELVRRQPEKSHLPAFYLSLAGAGVLGGSFINILAPLIFNQCWDFYLILFGLSLVVGYTILQNGSQKRSHLFSVASWCVSFVGLALLFGYHLNTTQKNIVYHHRNFFGAMEIAQITPNPYREGERSLRHGNIIHGHQFTQAAKRRLPTTYYGEESGVGLSIAYQRQKSDGSAKGLNIGVIGLGTGTIAALSQKGDVLRFYEIDPDIVSIAKKYFTFLQDTPASTDIIIGDGRLSLAQRLRENGSDNYDVLAVDAFNGDAIPLHLLTIEAFQTYLKHLKPHGILAFHISSRYVDLYPPVQALATKLNLNAYVIHNMAESKTAVSAAEWVLVSRDQMLGSYLYQKKALQFKENRTQTLWTDEKNNLLAAIRW